MIGQITKKNRQKLPKKNIESKNKIVPIIKYTTKKTLNSANFKYINWKLIYLSYLNNRFRGRNDSPFAFKEKMETTLTRPPTNL